MKADMAVMKAPAVINMILFIPYLEALFYDLVVIDFNMVNNFLLSNFNLKYSLFTIVI